jgi:hypothetical protein
MTDPETTKALVELGAKFLDTFGEQIQDVVGYFGGDWLHAKRKQNREWLKARKDQIHLERGITQLEQVSPSVGVPLLLAAQEESQSDLQEIWARLLAAVEDPVRARSFRQEFIPVLKQFNPIDAQIMQVVFQTNFVSPDTAPVGGTSFKSAEAKLSISRMELEVSFENLKRLNCVAKLGGGGYTITSFGRLLMAAIS